MQIQLFGYHTAMLHDHAQTGSQPSQASSMIKEKAHELSSFFQGLEPVSVLCYCLRAYSTQTIWCRYPENIPNQSTGLLMIHCRFCNMGRVTPAKPEIGGVGPSEIVGARNLKAIKTSALADS